MPRSREMVPEATAAQLMQVVASKMEKTEPWDTVLETLRQNEGKRVDDRLISKIRAACGTDDIRKICRYGKMYIQVGPWSAHEELTVGHSEANVFVNVNYILENNARYYSARDERNAKRRIALQHPEIFEQLATAINNYRAAADIVRGLLNDDNLTETNELEKIAETGARLSY